MPIVELIKAIAALAVTLGIFGLGVVALRKYGPDVFKRMAPTKGPKRLAVESLLLDPHRRLVLVSLDGREKLILLGEGRLLADRSAEAA